MAHLLRSWLVAWLLLFGAFQLGDRTDAQEAEARRQPADGAILMTGDSAPGLAHLDEVMRKTLTQRGIPGAALAIVKEGRLVMARGYGWANVEAREQVQPTSLFNLASCTKPFTAAGILKLVEEGKLRLDDHVFQLLGDLRPLGGGKVDPRLQQITVRQLLHHWRR